MSSENKKIQNIIFDYGDKIDFLKQKIKDLTKNQNTLKSNLRRLMAKIKSRLLIGKKVKVEIRIRRTFDIDLLEKNFPELYKKYTRIEKKTITIVEEELIFDEEKMIKFNEEEYKKCFISKTSGVYITRF